MYERNVLVWGEENQDILKESRVLVLGTDFTAQLILAGLAGMGIGHIGIISDERINKQEYNLLCPTDPTLIGKRKTSALKETLCKINPELEVYDLFGTCNDFFLNIVNPQIIVSTQTDIGLLTDSMLKTRNHHIPFIYIQSHDNYGSVETLIDSGIPQWNNDLSQSNPMISGVCAGMACEEIRKCIIPYNEVDTYQRYISYSPSAHNRRTINLRPSPVYHSIKKAAVFGAGGIGTYAALQLALMGVRQIDIYDMDHVEAHNLNRQVLFYDAVGESKSKVLASRIKDISPQTTCVAFSDKVGHVYETEDWLQELFLVEQERGIVTSIEELIALHYSGSSLLSETDIIERRYDLLVGCVDNKYARLWINSVACKLDIPYIDGGVSYRSGQIACYIPNKTPCVDCQLHLAQYPSIRASCNEESQGSVVSTNMVIGSALFAEFFYALQESYQGSLYFDTLQDKRLYVNSVKNMECSH